MKTGGFIQMGFILSLAALMWGCGSQHRLPEKDPVTLGVIPFSSDRMSRESAELNHHLFRFLHSSGRFRVVQVRQAAALLNLGDLTQGTGSVPAAQPDSAAVPDSLDNSRREMPRWVLTGVFIREVESVHKRPLVPFVLFRPANSIVAEVEYRLYDTQDRRWLDIRRLQHEEKRGGGLQVVDYNSADPSLAVLAKERQQWRKTLYDGLFNELVESVENLTYANR